MRDKSVSHDRPVISVIFPAYNEEKRIRHSLEKTARYLADSGRSFEIIVVDDGSSDATTDVSRSALEDCGADFNIIRLEKNRGKGYAVKTGMSAARGDFIFFSDADLSTPIEEIDRLLPLLEGGCDVAIGSRALRESRLDKRQPIYRESSGKLFNLAMRAVLLPGIKDSQCGFKGFRAEAARRIAGLQKFDGFSFDVEMLWLARKLCFGIKEVPVSWSNNPDTRVSYLKDGLGMVADLFKIRLAHRKTNFKP
jgi:dolichyl-phosphate beta-glucosyltransferase